MKEFFLCFVPLFVAVDAIGILPLFMSMTEGLEPKKVRRVIIQSIITAMVVALVFLAIGQLILKFIGISVSDFMIAGGVLLFILSLRDMVSSGKTYADADQESVGSVPLGVPLIVGPAVLTTTILLSNQYGWLLTVIATVLNILIAGGVFFLSIPIYRFLGKPGSKTVSKLASLLLAAIAVMMVRKGIEAVLAGHKLIK